MSESSELLYKRLTGGGPVSLAELRTLAEATDAETRAVALYALSIAARQQGATNDVLRFLKSACRECGHGNAIIATECIAEALGTGNAGLAVETGFQAATAALKAGRDAEALEAFSAAWGLDFRHLALTYASDRTFAKQIGRLYSALAARHRPGSPRPPGPLPPNGPLRIAYVVPNVVDATDGPTKLLRSLALHHDPKRFEIHVYSTEMLSRRPAPRFPICRPASSSFLRGATTCDRMAQIGVPTTLAPNRGTFLDSAAALARRIREDDIHVAVYVSSLACTIDCVIAAWRPAPLNLNINVGCPMFVPELDGVIYVVEENSRDDRAVWEGEPTRPYLLARGLIDVDEDLAGAPPTRASLGIPENAMIFLTTGNYLPTRLSTEFVELIAQILHRVPRAWFLTVGQENLPVQDAAFRALGVRDRVKFHPSSLTAPLFTRVADVYLNGVPDGGGGSVVEAMAADIPVIAMRCGPEHVRSAGAAYVARPTRSRSTRAPGTWTSPCASRVIPRFAASTGKRCDGAMMSA